MTHGVVVVGGSLAGLRAAEALRASGWGGPLTVVGAEAELPYNRPPLTKDALRADARLGQVLLPRRPSVDDVEWHLGSAVVRADLDRRLVLTSTGRELPYAGLVVATGLRPRRLAWARGSRRSHAVRTLADARRLGAAIEPGRRVVVVGAGPVGCEVATRAVDLGARVVLVDPAPGPMVRQVGSAAAAALARLLEDHGVRLELGRLPVALEEPAPGADARGAAVRLADGGALTADVVVEAVGSSPNTEWLSGTALDLADGVACDALLRAGGRPDVVACGDVARIVGPGAPPRSEHWATAVATARAAAGTLAAHLLREPGEPRSFTHVPSFWSDQAGLRVQGRGWTGGELPAQLLDGTPEAARYGMTIGFRCGEALVGAVAIGPREYTARSLASAPVGRPVPGGA